MAAGLTDYGVDGRAGSRSALDRGPSRRIARILGRLWPWPSLVAAPLLAMSAALGLPGLALAGLIAGHLGEWSALAAGAQPSGSGPLLPAGAHGRPLLLSLLALATLGTSFGGAEGALAGYALAVAALHLAAAWVAGSLDSVLAAEPAIGVRNLGRQLELRSFFPRVRLGRELGGLLLLGVELPLFAGVWLLERREASWAVALAVGLIALASGWLARGWARRFLGSGRVERYERDLHRELATFDPEVAVHVTAGGAGAYTVNQWLDALNVLRRRVVVLARNRGAARDLGETRWPVLVTHTARQLEAALTPNVVVALYPTSTGPNMELLQELGIEHVFLNHGDSDKLSSANPVSRVYDEVWVAGEAAVDRYESAGVAVSRDRFRIVGRPQVEQVRTGDLPGPTRVLYAPTFEGFVEKTNYSSLETMGVEMVRRIVEGRPDIGVIFRPHPRTGRFRPGMARARREVSELLRRAPNADLHVVADDEPPRPLHEHLNLAHVLISDISSVTTDFLQSQRPIIVTNPRGLTLDEFLSHFPTQSAGYLLGPEPTGIDGILDEALGDDPKRAERGRMRSYVLGDHPAGPLESFRAAVDALCDEAAAGRARRRTLPHAEPQSPRDASGSEESLGGTRNGDVGGEHASGDP